MTENRLQKTDDGHPFRRAEEGVRVVLVKPSHPGNIGAAARALGTMGFARLYLVEPRRFPAPEATAMASGADRILDAATVVPCLSEALSGCALVAGFSARPREFAGRVLAVRELAEEVAGGIKSQQLSEVALVFGTEMTGLTNAELAHCNVAVTIPANPLYSSLNLAQAVQVATYELHVALTSGKVWQAPRFAPATNDEIERLFVHAKETLTASGFLNPQRPKRLMPRLRRLFARAGLEHEEVNILRGILTTVDKLIRKTDDVQKTDDGRQMTEDR